MKTIVYHNSKIFEASDEGEESGMIRITVTDQGGGGTSALFPLAELMPALVAFDAKNSRNEKEVVAEQEDNRKVDDSYRIIINTQERYVGKFFDRQLISYETLVEMTYPDAPKDVLFTVTWQTKAPSQSGSLTPGQSVILEEGMIFDITHTGNA